MNTLHNTSQNDGRIKFATKADSEAVRLYTENSFS